MLKTILQIFKASQGTIRPHFTLSGSSGSGKTYSVKQEANALRLPVIEVNAAQLTKEGYSGNSLSKALVPIRDFKDTLTVCFIDEFDKLYLSSDEGGGTNSITIGVQNEFLKILEGETTSTFGDYGKYHETHLDKVLFVFAGAFNNTPMRTTADLQKIGVKREFLGRVGLHLHLSPPSKDELLFAVQNSELIHKYLKLLKNPKHKRKCIKAIQSELFSGSPALTLGYRDISRVAHTYFLENTNLLNIEPTSTLGHINFN